MNDKVNDYQRDDELVKLMKLILAHMREWASDRYDEDYDLLFKPKLPDPIGGTGGDE